MTPADALLFILGMGACGFLAALLLLTLGLALPLAWPAWVHHGMYVGVTVGVCGGGALALLWIISR